jgi:hypothetical protein
MQLEEMDGRISFIDVCDAAGITGHSPESGTPEK